MQHSRVNLQQLRFLRVFKFQIGRQRRFGTVLLERRDGVDGFDLLRLAKEWTVTGRECVFSIAVPKTKLGSELLPRRHYTVYTVTSRSAAKIHNPGLAALTTEDPIHLAAEIIVTRRSADQRHFVDVAVTERSTAEAIAVS